MHKPLSEDQALAQALELHRGGKLGPAIRAYEKIVRRAPQNAAAQRLLGIACFQDGQLKRAATALSRALELDPALPDVYYNLGIVLHRLGRYEEAVQHLGQAAAAHPDDAEALLSLGATLKELGHYEEAVERYRQALTINSGYAEVHCNLAGALVALERFEEAIDHARRAIQLQPGMIEAHYFLGSALEARDRGEEAEQYFARVLEGRPVKASDYLMRGMALAMLKREAESLTELDRALRLDPALCDAHMQRGLVLLVLGRLDEARRCFEKAIELVPKKIGAHAVLATIERFSPDDPRLAKLEALARDMDGLGGPEGAALHAALGKAYADLKQPERSFPHVIEGNRLKRQGMPYDEATTLEHMRIIADVFDADLLDAKRGQGNPSRLPIFIIGMPRSGTTLIEQILASHPRVFGAGELLFFSRLARRLRDGTGPPRYPEAVPAQSPEALRELGANYVREVQALAPEAERITDKMPTNFLFAGLIHLTLPNAKIIHTRRNPLDNCMSCFSTQFAKGLPWSYDLGELGRYHRAYQALMEHWRCVLPEGAMLEVDYEEVVADLEGQARRIVAYCDLEWDEACLGFHKTERPVHTASVTQVRQPIYRSSVGRWAPYKEQLGPLFEALQIEVPQS